MLTPLKAAMNSVYSKACHVKVSAIAVHELLPTSSELLHGAESPDSADGFSASALSTVSTQQSTD